MSRTYKDTKSNEYKVMTAKRAGNPLGCLYGCCGWRRKSRLYKKHTAKVERQRDKRLVRDEVENYYSDIWYDLDWSDPIRFRQYLYPLDREEVFVFATLNMNTGWLAREQFYDNRFYPLSYENWDGTITINLTQLVKEVTHG